MERQIVHIDVNAFAVSVERVADSRLRERPVIVAYPAMDRSVVQSVSPEARQAGIYRGMLLRQALRMCREIIVVPPNEPLYSRAMQAMINIMSRFTPIVEPASYGHVYLDMTGTVRLFGMTVDTAVKIQREIQTQISLPTSLGVASNKLVSKIAAEVIPPGEVQQVQHGNERKFIAPFKIHHLPTIDQGIKKQLSELNIQIIREIAELSLPHLTMIFGKAGLKLHRASHGIDNTPVLPPQQLPNIYKIHTLGQDTNDVNLLRGALYQLVEKVGRQLRQQGQTARKLMLKIYYADHREAIGQQKLPAATNMDRELFVVADELLKKILTRRIRVRKLGVRYFQLKPVSKQMSFFDRATPNTDRDLTRAMDQIRKKFGEDSLQFAVTS